MKAWKTVAALVLALGLTAGFAACGDDKGNGVVNNSGSSVGGSVSDTVSDESSDVVGDDSSDVVSDESSDVVSDDSSDVGGDVGGDVAPSGEVTEEEFKAAIAASYAAMNFTLVRTDPNGTTTSNSADGKVYSVAQGANSISYCYMGEVDDVYYMWTSDYGDYWDYSELEWAAECHPASGESALSDILRWCEFSYAVYHEDIGMYQFANLGAPTVYAKVENGKIVKCRMETSQTEWVEMEITYGNATVGELPPLE
ncbi:MAG: hypothetical protein E7352_05520 [Clostridiales bacterium]|nr:hypothetical protein [Clostridiales bacterium]